MKLLYVNSVRDTRPGVCEQAAQFRELCAANAPIIKALRDEAEHHTMKREMLKKSLKAMLFNGVWPGDGAPLGRKNEQLKASGLGLIDFDHVGDAVGFWETQCVGLRDGYEVVLAHVSASGDGLHVVVRLRAGQTIGELYADADRLTGATCDKACRNLGRIAFLPGPEDVLVDEMESVFAAGSAAGGSAGAAGLAGGSAAVSELFAGDSEAGADGVGAVEGIVDESRDARDSRTARTTRSVVAGSPAGADGSAAGGSEAGLAAVCGSAAAADGGGGSAAGSAAGGSSVTAVERPVLYRGLSRAAIVWALTRGLGGLPEVGERHEYVKRMAVSLRYMCDNDVDWVIDSLPRIGLPDDEVRKLVETICGYKEYLNMPAALRRAMEYVESNGANELAAVAGGGSGDGGSDDGDSGDGDDEGDDDDDDEGGNGRVGLYESDVPPAMPDVVPPLIDLLCSRVPDFLKPAVSAAVMPSLAAHLYNVVFRYVDGVEHLPALMSVIVGKQSVGKSAVNKPIQFIIEDIRRRDMISREREQAWKDECSKLAANKEKPQRPDDICIQLTQADMTNAAFVRRLEDARGRFLYTNVDEIEMLRALRGYRADSLSQILRLAFDGGEYGQERVGGTSVSATVRMRWCWMASTTPRRLQDFFAKNLVDGTLSRINLQYVHAERHGKIPKIKPYDIDFVEALQPYIDRLSMASGLYESAAVNSLINTLLAENDEFSVLSDSETFETFSFRAAVIAFRKAMILYIAHGCVWDDAWNDYIRWTMQSDLWCKLHFFGTAVEDANKSLLSSDRRGPVNMLTMLPERFTRETLLALRHQRGMYGNPKYMLCMWQRRGYIRKEGNVYVQLTFKRS